MRKGMNRSSPSLRCAATPLPVSLRQGRQLRLRRRHATWRMRSNRRRNSSPTGAPHLFRISLRKGWGLPILCRDSLKPVKKALDYIGTASPMNHNKEGKEIRYNLAWVVEEG